MSMTIEEAIKRINQHMSIHHIGQYPHIHLAEAMQMAIDALQEKAEREDPKPLTIEQLRQMDGEPVYIVDQCKESTLLTGWIVFSHHHDDGFVPRGNAGWFSVSGYGERWLAYRHKPKGVE